MSEATYTYEGTPAEKWVAALRSGEFAQGLRALHRIHQDGREDYCCLGVACALAVREGVVDPGAADGDFVPNEGGFIKPVRYGKSMNSGTLPDEVRTWLGLRTEDGEFYDTENYDSLAKMNDNGASFEEIADAIVERRTGLFCEKEEK